MNYIKITSSLPENNISFYKYNILKFNIFPEFPN
jgi:hypothetical protein